MYDASEIDRDVTLGGQADSQADVKWCHGRHLESVTSNWKSELRQSMRIYSRNSLAKFHPDPIRNDGVFELSGRRSL